MKRHALVVGVSALSLALSGLAFAEGEKSYDPSKQGAITVPDLSSSYKVSDLMDISIKNARDEDLGSVSELIVDKDGKVSHLVLQEGGVLGVGQNKYVVPWDRVQLSPGEDVAIIDVNKDQLSSEFAAFEEYDDSAPSDDTSRSAPPSGGANGSSM